MRLIKSTGSQPRRCEYGDFEIQPDDGWQLSQTFIDNESGLLVVSVHASDQSIWVNNGYGGRTIPTREYKIDLHTLRILEPREWQRYFNYEPVITMTADSRYKLVTQRLFEPDRNSDGIKEELYDAASGELISSGNSIAFQKTKRETLLESLYRSIAEREKSEQELDAKPTLQLFYEQQLKALKENETIIAYSTENRSYKLVYGNGGFSLYEGDKIISTTSKWEQISFSLVKTYDSLDAFWKDLTEQEKWFMYYNIHRAMSTQPLVLAKHVIGFFNTLRRNHQFTYAEYDEINRWTAVFYSDVYKSTELKQWCPNCGAEVSFQARYPKYICAQCMDKEKFDLHGNRVEFSNIGFSGGLRIVYIDRHGRTLREDDTQTACTCIIDGKHFITREARFGGIVIQTKE